MGPACDRAGPSRNGTIVLSGLRPPAARTANADPETPKARHEPGLRLAILLGELLVCGTVVGPAAAVMARAVVPVPGVARVMRPLVRAVALVAGGVVGAVPGLGRARCGERRRGGGDEEGLAERS